MPASTSPAMRNFTDRHGPFAYFCVVAIVVLSVTAPGVASVTAGTVAAIYLGRAIERGYRGGEEVKAGK